MKAGQLRHRIIIQQQVKSQNAIDEWITSWEDWVTCWANIEPAVGKQYYEAKQLDSKVDGKIRIRYRTGVKPTMRVLHGQRILKIVSIIQPQENRKELVLMYTEELD